MKLYLWYIVFTEKKIVCMKISKKIPDYEHSDFVISYHSTSINETLIVCSKTKDDKKGLTVHIEIIYTINNCKCIQ